MTIPLIDKQDTFEIIDFQIAAILATETLAQQVLADDAGKDPDLWKFNVYSERFTPWEVFQDDIEPTPIVNVWFDNDNFSMKDGDSVGRQAATATYNIDIYAAQPSSDNPSGGYNKSDEESAIELHRIIRLVRNIIMHPDNTYLQLSEIVNGKKKNIVWYRWIQSIEKFQPQIGDRPVQNVIAARVNLEVKFNEAHVIEDFEPLELVFITAKRADDGKIIFESELDTT